MSSDDDKDKKKDSSFFNTSHLTIIMVAVVGVLFLGLLFKHAPTPVIHVTAHENSFARAMKMDRKAMHFGQVESDAEISGTRALRDTESTLAEGASERKGMNSQIQVSKQTRLTGDE
jgi:hypothetical protein